MYRVNALLDMEVSTDSPSFYDISISVTDCLDNALS